MRRALVSLIAISFCFLSVCSCDNSSADNSIKSPVIYFSANAEIVSDSICMTADIISNHNQSVRIDVLSPDSLKGITYELKNSQLTISMNGLRCIAQPDYLPSKSFQRVVCDVLVSLTKTVPKYQSTSGDTDIYSGRCDMGEYTIEADSNTGYIKKLSPMYCDVCVTFDNIKPIE